jgi:hypothetical protein
MPVKINNILEGDEDHFKTTYQDMISQSSKRPKSSHITGGANTNTYRLELKKVLEKAHEKQLERMKERQ